jgi:glycine/D-amino acid oxidase-like deaminating enzyme
VAGFILNCGWGGKGITQSPIAGQLAAEFICYGRTTTMSLEPFRIERFEEPGISSLHG